MINNLVDDEVLSWGFVMFLTFSSLFTLMRIFLVIVVGWILVVWLPINLVVCFLRSKMICSHLFVVFLDIFFIVTGDDVIKIGFLIFRLGAFAQLHWWK